MRGPGRGALVAGLVALLFGVIAGFEISAHAEYDGHHEKPKFDSYLELVTKETLQAEGEFDYFKFSQRWPGTYCKLGACCENVVEPTIFTVHGFWPENSTEAYPSCCSGPAFDQNELSPIVQLLEHYWPSVSCSSPTQCDGKEANSLWEQEWQKHGTCAFHALPYFQVAGYFYLSIEYAQRYDIAQILKGAGFVPDSSEQYNTSEMIAAVKAAVGASPAFTCKSNKIYAIQICLTKTLEVRDCLPVPSSDSCPPTLVFAPYES